MRLHKIELTGYCAKSPKWPAMYLGTAGSYGNEQLAVTLGKGWEGLTVTATFQPAGVTVLVPGDGTLDVPWEATETALDAAKGRIVFEGVTDGRVLISTDIPYAVGSHSDTEGSNSQPPTPSEWEQYVDEVKGDADRAEQAAKDAEATLQDVKNAGAQAVTDIGAAKNSALEAIDAAREEATGSISADVEGAKQAAADAEQSAADAEQSAKNAADALANVQSAGQSALDDIATERQNTLSDIQTEGGKQQSAVAGAGTAALEAIGRTEQAAINQIKQTGETQVGAVQSAGTTQISQINSAGAAQVQAVKDEGAAQTAALNDAADAHKNELESIASHPPQPNTATGKWQTWNAETGAYQDTDALYQGGYYTPAVSDDGVLTWQGSQPEMPAISGANIKGPKGDKGDPGLGVPAPTQADAGKVPMVNEDGTGYVLREVSAGGGDAGQPGTDGEDGGYYTPSVDTAGNLSWTPSKVGMPSVPEANIRGPQGPQGETGATPQLTIGTVTTLEPDEDATVTITGTAEAPVLNFGIPKGEQGDGSTGGSDLPATTAADSGKVPTVNAAGTGYELTGPYAPLSAAIIETVKGNPAVCEDCVEWGLQGMRVYGKSTQESTTGAQLISFPLWNAPVTINGITLTPTDTGFTVSGTATAQANFISDKTFALEENDYILSSAGIRDATDRLCIYHLSGIPYCDIIMDSNISTVSAIPEGTYSILYQVLAGQTVNKEYSHIMLNTGSTALPFESYTGGKPSPSPEYPQPITNAGEDGSIDITISDGADQSQQLIIQTPNGLPGIPVGSGGNYTDAEGQQWVCDEVDFARGICVQRIGHGILDGTNLKFKVSPNGLFWDARNSAPGLSNEVTVISNIFPVNVLLGNADFGFVFSQPHLMTPYFPTVDELNAFLVQKNTEGNPLEFYYIKNPTEAPLSDDELTAYRALHTYDGTTVLTPDNALASLEVDYIVKPKAYIEKKLTAIEQKIQEVAAAQIDTQTGG